MDDLHLICGLQCAVNGIWPLSPRKVILRLILLRRSSLRNEN